MRSVQGFIKVPMVIGLCLPVTSHLDFIWQDEVCPGLHNGSYGNWSLSPSDVAPRLDLAR